MYTVPPVKSVQSEGKIDSAHQKMYTEGTIFINRILCNWDFQIIYPVRLLIGKDYLVFQYFKIRLLYSLKT